MMFSPGRKTFDRGQLEATISQEIFELTNLIAIGRSTFCKWSIDRNRCMHRSVCIE